MYPRRLLPSSNYHKMESIKGIGNHFVLRATPKGICVRKKIHLKNNFRACMQSKEFVDGVSVNLLSVFHKKDILFKADYRLHPEWELDWDEISSTPRPNGDVVRERQRGYFGFRVRDLSTIFFDYFPIKGVDDPTMPPMHLTLRMEHRPTKLNFWHCTIFICEQDTLSDIRHTFDEKVIKRMAKCAVPLIQNIVLLPKSTKEKRISKKFFSK